MADLRSGSVQKANHAHTRRLHERRLGDVPVAAVDDDEVRRQLAALQRDWMKTSPAYRELIRQRVAEAARAAEKRWKRIERGLPDVDNLGREIEGCG